MDQDQQSKRQLSLHRDCLLETMTFLCYNDLWNEEVASVSMAVVFGFEEFVDERVSVILSQLRKRESNPMRMSVKIIIINEFLCDLWMNDHPMIESVEDMRGKVELRIGSRVNKISRIFERVRALQNDRMRVRLLGLENAWMDGGKG